MNIQKPATHTLIHTKRKAVSITPQFDVGNAVIKKQKAELDSGSGNATN
jgi:hypothetical protein